MENKDVNATEKRELIEPACRGYVYEFMEKDGTCRNDVLVVSSDSRRMDRLISIIMIGDNGYGYDVVPIKYNGKTRYLHCGTVTYCARERLGKKICQASQQVMENITLTISNELGIESEGLLYKKLYNELLEKTLGGEIVSRKNGCSNWTIIVTMSEDKESDIDEVYRYTGTEEEVKQYLLYLARKDTEGKDGVTSKPETVEDINEFGEGMWDTECSFDDNSSIQYMAYIEKAPVNIAV